MVQCKTRYVLKIQRIHNHKSELENIICRTYFHHYHQEQRRDYPASQGQTGAHP